MNTPENPFATKEEKVANTINSMYESQAAVDPTLPDLYAKLLYSMSDGDLSKYDGITIPDSAKEGIDPKKGIVIVTDDKFGMQMLYYKLYLWDKNNAIRFDVLDRRKV